MNLRFISLTLENFACFTGNHLFQLDRSPGLYFITGNNLVEPTLTSNGCGKSTLFNALFWALTGKTLRIQRPGASIESWHSTKTVKVILELEVGEQLHYITRTRKPNSLTLDAQPVDQQVINDLLKLNEETLKRTILVGQFVPLFLDLKAEQQSSLFSEALDLDLWLDAAEKASQEHKVHEGKKAKLEVVQSSLSGRLDQLGQQYQLECDREKNFQLDKKYRIYDLKDQCRLADELSQSAYAALERAIEPGSDFGGASTGGPAIAALRARERILARAETDIVAQLRLAQHEVKSITANLSRYQSSTEVCPECKQQVNQAHIEQKKQDLTLQHTKWTQDVSDMEQQYKKNNLELEKVRRDLAEEEANQKAKHIAYIEQQRVYMEVKRKYDSASFKANELKKELEKTRNSTNPYTATCEELAETYLHVEEQLTDINNQIKEVDELSSIYKYWTTGYKEIRLNLIDETLQELEMVANRHCQLLGLNDWQIEFRTERENKSGTVSHSFTTMIYPSGQDKPIQFDSYSGGESQRLQLAVTAALSEILLERAGISTNIEVLDEPSRHLSSQGITDLLECLKERADTLHRCIYFIDHNSLESGHFDQVITIEKSRDGSRILTS